MTVEQALAARELLAEQAQNQLAKMEHITATDPDAVDPAVLAEQIALAERAAVLNRRAAAKQKLAEQNSQPAARRNDPTTANNLAMVTPLEFVQVPGVERPVMKRPATYLRSGGHQPGSPGGAAPEIRQAPSGPVPPAGCGSATGRGRRPGPGRGRRQGRLRAHGTPAGGGESRGSSPKRTSRAGSPSPRIPPTDWNPWTPPPPAWAGRAACASLQLGGAGPWGRGPDRRHHPDRHRPRRLGSTSRP